MSQLGLDVSDFLRITRTIKKPSKFWPWRISRVARVACRKKKHETEDMGQTKRIDCTLSLSFVVVLVLVIEGCLN